MQVGFGILLGNAQVKGIRLQDKAIFRDLESHHLVMQLGIQHAVAVGSQVFAEVYVVGIGAQTFAPERLNNDGSLLHFF